MTLNRTVDFWLSEEDAHRLQTHASNQGVSVEQLIRSVIEQELDRRDGKNDNEIPQNPFDRFLN